jgi:cell division transport system permease protein
MMYALREAIAGFRRAPLLLGLSAAMIGLSFYVGGLFAVAAHNLHRVVGDLESRVEVVGFIRDDADPASVRAAQQEIEEYPEVREVNYVSREAALETARRELTDFEAIFSALEMNPLPASLNVLLRAQQHDAQSVRDVAERVAGFAVIEDVRFGADWLDSVFLLRRVAGLATAVLGLAFALVAVLIIGAAIRMAIFARRDEITIMRLVGATEAFVRGPFLLEGMLVGVIGSIAALTATWLTFRAVSNSLLALEWLPVGWIVAGVLAGALLGMAASAYAVHRHANAI